MKKVLVAYVPVLHKGYLDLFERHKDSTELAIIADDVLEDFDHVIRKDIRRVPPAQMQKVITALGLFEGVTLLDKKYAEKLKQEMVSLVLADDEVTRTLAGIYFAKNTIEWDKAFLRWHRDNTLEQNTVDPDETVSVEQADRELIARAKKIGNESLDWYRQVGALLTRDGEILLQTVNRHMPSEQQAYTVGDPRSIFKRNLNIELSSAMHCEASLIAEAAKRGIKTEGCSVYVTDFPCPPCAKVLACSGITKLFYAGGYAVLDGGTILKEAGIKIIHVK